MIRYLFITIFSINLISSDEDHHMHQNSHNHYVYVQGEKLEVDQDRFKSFLDGLSNSQVAVKKIDVDLERGKVLIAYTKEKEIDFDEIKSKILANGQNAIDFSILNI